MPGGGTVLKKNPNAPLREVDLELQKAKEARDVAEAKALEIADRDALDVERLRKQGIRSNPRGTRKSRPTNLADLFGGRGANNSNRLIGS